LERLPLSNSNEEMIVTPWEVSGKIDYDKLTREFGTENLTIDLLERFQKYTGSLHTQLRRRIFFSHRDFNWVLDEYDKGNKFALYTGRGPSGPVHIGHIVPWIFTKHLQDVFTANLFFQMTDDEKFLIHQNKGVDDPHHWAYENSLDIIAIGFDPKRTVIISDIKNIRHLYELAIKVAKHMTFSTVKAVFGFQDSSNIGIIFFPAIQSVPAFLPSALAGKGVPCLIPAAIDQDPYWRITRDVAPKLGYPKPAQIHSKFLPGLGKGGKMSASMPQTAIFTTDSLDLAEKKIMNAFTGGRATVEEQRRLGANPDICSVYHYEYFLFMDSDKDIEQLRRNCLSGNILCGECKEILAERVKPFLREHQARREKAKDHIEEFLAESKGLDLPE
jgi:tryptophanyl-tRNA synthetase